METDPELRCVNAINLVKIMGERVIMITSLFLNPRSFQVKRELDQVRVSLYWDDRFFRYANSHLLVWTLVGAGEGVGEDGANPK